MPPVDNQDPEDENIIVEGEDPDGTATETDNGESGDNSDANSDTGTETDETSDTVDTKSKEDDGEDGNQRTSAYIRRLKREKRQAERALEEERRKAAEARRQAQTKAAPKREDFDDDEAYLDARVKYEVAAATPDVDEAPPTGYEATFVSAGISRTDSKHLSESMVEAQSEHSDFTEATKSANGLTKEVFEGLAETDNPGEVLYYLSKHQKELSRISQLGDPKAIAVQLGRVEERMELSGKLQSADRSVSNAPDPITPVGGGKDVPSSDNPDALTDEEFFAQRNAEILRERGLA